MKFLHTISAKISPCNPERRLPRLVYCLALIVCLSCFISPLHADTSISFGGRSYPVTENTVVLDAEGILNYPGSYQVASEAFRKINSLPDQAILLVAPSVYWIDDPDDPEIRSDKQGTPYAFKIKCNDLSIIGLSENPEDVVFAANRGQTQGAVGNFTLFHFSGNSLTTKNITYGNYCNVDLIYPRNPKLNRKKRKDAIVQAQIGICENTDRLFADNCRFISRLNLCPFVGARRSLYENCYFECTDDALSGSAIYLDCKFTFFSSKPFYSTAETGAVFLNCDITCLGSGVQYFTKVPGQVTAIDTRFYCDKPIDIKWTRDASDVTCRQENISLNGQPYIIDSDRPELGPSLVDTSLRNAYKIEHDGKAIYNITNLLKGTDNWDPLGFSQEIAYIESKSGIKLTDIPVTLRITSDAPKQIFNGDTVLLKATPLLWGGYQTGNPEEFAVVAENVMPIGNQSVFPISTSDGLTARHTLTIQPNLREAPEFKKNPKIVFDKNSGKFKVNYSLNGKGEDHSSIIWTRCKDIDGTLQVVELMQADAPEGKLFTAKAADLGSSIIAVVTPRFADSKAGLTASSTFFEINDASMIEEIPESRLSTDFHDVSIQKRCPGIQGAWSFDVFKPTDTSHVEWATADGPGWYYGKGFDASTGIGLVQSEKGARLSYIPARDECHDMTISLVAEPAKSGGQGFGSATSQYMDICVKFDPVNLDGYALRIERTPDHDRAVRFSLIKYDKGKTSVISDEVISNCYRTSCFITVGITDGLLQASAYTDAPLPDRKCCEDVVGKVELKAPVEDSMLSGFCIQHTGSTGPSSTLLRDLNIIWQ